MKCEFSAPQSDAVSYMEKSPPFGTFPNGANVSIGFHLLPSTPTFNGLQNPWQH
jgi:hypothetical protein